MNEILKDVKNLSKNERLDDGILQESNDHINLFYGKLTNFGNIGVSDDKLSYSKSINLNNIKSNEELDVAALADK